MEYVQQYVFAKYPQYSHGLVEAEAEKTGLKNHQAEEKKPNKSSNLTSFLFNSGIFFELNKTRLEPSRLLEILAKKSSHEGSFVSIPEVRARSRALRLCGLEEEDYSVLFAANPKDAMLMIGESYPFFKGNLYMLVFGGVDFIKDFAILKDSKVILALESWLDLRIKGSQLSQYFRKKCKFSPKGLFAYPARLITSGTTSSMHWISEAHRNSWHVVLDATGLGFDDDRIALSLRWPDFVLCSLGDGHGQPCTVITCLLVLKKSFDALASSV